MYLHSNRPRHIHALQDWCLGRIVIDADVVRLSSGGQSLGRTSLRDVKSVWRNIMPCGNLPMCSAFSQLRFSLEGLSTGGN